METLISEWNSLADFEGTDEEFAAEEAALLAGMVNEFRSHVIVDEESHTIIVSPEITDENAYLLNTLREMLVHSL